MLGDWSDEMLKSEESSNLVMIIIPARSKSYTIMVRCVVGLTRQDHEKFLQIVWYNLHVIVAIDASGAGFWEGVG